VVVVRGPVVDVDGEGTVVDEVGGVAPYATADIADDATTTATRTTPPRMHLNITTPVGIRATDLQRSPQ
jgi:hypothetical protein